MIHIQYEYKEELMSMSVDLLTQINKQGEYGWRFHSMAQRLTKSVDFKTGQPKIDIVLIYERQIINKPIAEA